MLELFRFCAPRINEAVFLRLKFPDQVSSPGDALPEYETPPVIETSIGLQFEGLSGYQSLDAASFHARIRDKFPRVEEHPPMDPAFETFGPRSSLLGTPQLQLIQAAIQPRYFFLNEDGSELVQLQRDRLFYNWRKRGAEYPRYAHVRATLLQLLESFSSWASDESLGTPIPTQVEAVYVNAIPLVDSEGSGCGLSFIFPWLKGLRGMTEDGLFQFRRRLLDEAGEPVARLNFSLRYGTDEGSARSAQLMLHVRGHPAGPSFENCVSMIDAQREVIVRTFTEITSPSAHALWRRR